jgi:hypothetical protein
VKMTAAATRPVGVCNLSFARVTRSIPTSVPGDPFGVLTKNAITSAMMDNMAVAKTAAAPSRMLLAIPNTSPRVPFKSHTNRRHRFGAPWLTLEFLTHD